MKRRRIIKKILMNTIPITVVRIKYDEDMVITMIMVINRIKIIMINGVII